MSSNKELKVGCHVSKSKGLVTNIESLMAIGGTAVQFFLSPKQGAHAGIPLKDAEVQQILKLKDEKGLYTVVHGKYILNFARPNSKETEWQQKALITDLVQAQRIGTDVIIHQGKNVKVLNFTREQALQAFVTNIMQILDKTSEMGLTNKIILENSCQAGTEMGYTIEELADIYKRFSKKHQDRLGFCLDLCHIHVAGTMDVRKETEVDSIFALFDTLIGLNKLLVIHFNDSQVRFDGHNDCHAYILIGYIGNPKIKAQPENPHLGFRKIVQIAKERNIPLILETPEILVPIEDQIKLVQSWSLYQEEINPVHLEYLKKFNKEIEKFAENPTSRKGNRAKTKIPIKVKVTSQPIITELLVPKKKIIIKKKILPPKKG